MTFFLTRFLCVADAGDVAEEVSESAAEDVAFVRWHLEGFLDGVGEAVVGELEVFEHGWTTIKCRHTLLMWNFKVHSVP